MPSAIRPSLAVITDVEAAKLVPKDFRGAVPGCRSQGPAREVVCGKKGCGRESSRGWGLESAKESPLKVQAVAIRRRARGSAAPINYLESAIYISLQILPI